jgi:hypothetical protein
MDRAPFDEFQDFTGIRPKASLVAASDRWRAVHACKLRASLSQGFSQLVSENPVSALKKMTRPKEKKSQEQDTKPSRAVAPSISGRAQTGPAGFSP